MPTWPATLPQTPPIDGVQIAGPRNSFTRVEMSAGPPQQRRTSTAAPRPATLTFTHLTAAQIATFESFFETDLESGALSFTMPHPITDASETWRFTQTGTPYSISHATRSLYQLTITLEML